LDEVQRTIRIIADLTRLVSQNKLDVVHMNSSCGKYGIIRDYLCARIIIRGNVFLVVHYHCNIEDQINNGKIQRLVFQQLTKRANVNLVLNKSSQKYLETVSRKNSILMTNFIERDFILNKNKSVNPIIKKVIFVGHVQVSKGVDEIFIAAKSFPEILFLLIGPVAIATENYSIPHNVFLRGPVSHAEMRELLSCSDIFLLPTYSEGFSIALLEAMAMGLPIITTPVGANKDMIGNDGGILVRCKNISDITTAINKLKDQSYRENISIWNIEKVRDSYTADNVMPKLISIYRLSGKRKY